MSANEEEVCPVHETSLTLEGDRNIVIAHNDDCSVQAHLHLEAAKKPGLTKAKRLEDLAN